MSSDQGREELDPLDDLLMERIAGGDAKAFNILAHRHMRRALAIAQGVLGNAHDADEIAQEAFMRVWLHADRWVPGKARFSTWLHRVVINLCLDRRRKARWVPLEAAGELVDSQAPSAIDILARGEHQVAVEQALAEIPARQKVAIALFYFEGLSGKGAAEAMGLKLSAFEQLLLRARRAVKSRLLARGFRGEEVKS